MIECVLAAREELELQCELAYLRTLLTVAARDRDDEALRALRPQLAATGMDLQRRRDEDRDGPMHTLADRFGLSDDELELVWTIVAVSADPRFAIPLDALWPGRRGIPISAYVHIRSLGAATGRELALWLATPNPLIDGGLVTVIDATLAPAARAYVASPRFLAHLVGDDTPSPGLTRIDFPLTTLVDDTGRRAISELSRLLAGPPVAIVLEGARGSGRSTAVAASTERPVVELDAARSHDLPVLAREAALGVALPLIANVDQLPAEPGAAKLGALLDSIAGHVVVTSARPNVELGATRPIVRMKWPLPDVATRAQLWEHVGDRPRGDLDALAMRYRVGAGTITRAVASARATSVELELTTAGFAEGLRHNLVEDLGGLVTPMTVTQSWSDLVLADDTRAQVMSLVARIRHAHRVLIEWNFGSKMARGMGVPALFSGPPGTGKTMVAGLIAKELGLELYQVDLSQITSKWVGETEKQLGKVFDAAEQGHALLLFDEADSLFGQRSQDVKGATDRYANMEVNFLLQRVEAFNGITILTTNLDSAIDSALKRRLAAHVVFELPDEEERAVLWKRMVTTGSSPLANDLDFDALARIYGKMSGANIRNAAIAAAFMAAGDREPMIRQEHLMRSARTEYRSMGHVLSDHR